MESTLLINRAFGETRVALLEGGVVTEIHVERDEELGLVGNVYKGRVTRVLPGMQAAFVDIGLPRAAFLYVDDVRSATEVAEPTFDPETAIPTIDEHEHEGDHDQETTEAPIPEVRKEQRSISELITEGEEIVCQVSKDPLGSKGARITTYVTLPGRYVVIMPSMAHVGISKRITDETERKRLRGVVERFKRDTDGGFIVRTEGAGIDEAKLAEDMGFVRSLWGEVEARAKSTRAPALLLPDLDLVLRAARDLFTREVERLIVDDPHELLRIQAFISKFSPTLAERVRLHTGSVPLFDQYGVETEIERTLLRKVGMKSGATIVIDQAEALTAIDVNTGRFVGKQNLEATILRTNLEAVKEIVTQLRLRNIGGLIVIDFIDMESEESRLRVYEAFLEELKSDRAKTHVLPISELGVIEMTRKRVRDSLERRLTEPCPYCDGRGRVRSRATVTHDVLREIARQAQKHGGKDLVVSASPEIAAILTEDKNEALIELETRSGRSVIVEARNDFHRETFQVRAREKAHGT